MGSTTVTVIDYKAGNLTSVVKALRHLGADVEVTDTPGPLANATRIILPGVGHFAATKRLDDTGLTDAIRAAISRGIPFLGICVGMQWLLRGSTEAPDQPGLGYFNGTCQRFPRGWEKVPHVGWNTILPRTSSASRLLAGIRPTDGGEYAYFTHSYYVPTGSAVFPAHAPAIHEGAVAAVTQHMRIFAAAVEYENVFGVQFHPEKSSETGLKILKNFMEFGA